MSFRPFNVYMDAVMKDENGEREDGSEISGRRKRAVIVWSLVCRSWFCLVNRKKTKVMVGRFVEVCRRGSKGDGVRRGGGIGVRMGHDWRKCQSPHVF